MRSRPSARRTKSPLALAAFCLMIAVPVRAVDVYVAPIVVVEESAGKRERLPDVGASLRALLSRRAFGGKVDVKAVGSSRTTAPRSLMEALKLAESRGYPYLIYGYIRRTDDSLFLELKLLDRDARCVQAVFFAGDGSDEYERLLADMDAKIAEYFKETLDAGPGRTADEPDYKRVWSLPASVGYWASASDGWSGALSGLVRAKAGARYWPRMPAFVKGSRKRQLGFGSDLEYALGMSAPGMEEAMFHSVLWRLEGQYETELDTSRVLGITGGPFARLDVLSQSRKYSSGFTDLSAGPGVGAEGYFMRRLSDRFSLGIAMGVDVTFYAEPFVDLTFALRSEYRFLPKEGDSK